MTTTRSPSRGIPVSVFAPALAVALTSQLFVAQSAIAAGGDFSLDFTAAAPLTYDHLTGGGTYDARQVGRNKDIVESLEGGDFACGDTVTFLTQIVVDAGAIGSQTIRLRFEFTAYATGQQGIALVDNGPGLDAFMNYVGDTGIADDSGSSATASDEGLTGAGVFIKPTTFFREVDVTDLEAGEKTVLRTDVLIACNGLSPTGNMQARLSSAKTIVGAGGEAISVGDQTIPFKRVGDVKKPPPK
jgi:hypothetical protein